MLNLPSWNWTQILETLPSQFANTPDVLRRAGISAESLKPLYIAPKNEPYGRLVLHRTDKFEVMLANWAQGAECAPHDHGFSEGVVWLVDGEFIETHYEFSNGLQVVGSKKTHPADSVLEVTPGDIHSMVALKGGISLHIYTPAIQEMKVFDTAARRVLTVNADCGAWVPRDKTQILDDKAWPIL